MANEAAWIVEGVPGADGTVVVTADHFVGPGVATDRTIRVTSLGTMPLVPFSFGLDEAPPIQPDTVLLFLGRSPVGGEWEPLHLHGGRARGVVWFVRDRVYGYEQPINPGPYELEQWSELASAAGADARPSTPADLRREVAAGLAARAKWEATLRIEAPAERAAALANWFGASSPDGPFWVERIWPDLRAEATRLGRAVGEPFARKLAAADDDMEVYALASVLKEVAAPAAVPVAVARLRDRRGVRPIHFVEILAAQADASAIDVLREVVDADPPVVAAAAARALRGCGDPTAADRIAARVPDRHEEAASVDDLAALLDGLHDLDADRALALAHARFAAVAPLWAARSWLARARPR
ncbi:MAG: hypothetical protein JNL08_13480 [Planctomycetes bacterium]|nr:hypothetical protein [Planctomycetota bacterium]